YVVQLDKRSCSCYRYNLTRIPCAHAMNAFMFERRKVEEYVSDYYQRETYLKTYSHGIDPVKGQESWDTCHLDPILPPLMKKHPGWPPTQRKRGLDEPPQPGKLRRQYEAINCLRCHQAGHNRRGCRGPKNARAKGKGTRKGKGSQRIFETYVSITYIFHFQIYLLLLNFDVSCL
ncbi:SWIM domain-containing protein, partial [Cephalotus follicularis]